MRTFHGAGSGFSFRALGAFLAARGALSACACFALVGWMVLDDYGIGPDAHRQRDIALFAVDYALGILETWLPDLDGRYGFVFRPRPFSGAVAYIGTWHSQYYGPAFELALLAAERVLDLQDSRHVHLLRNFLTHLFFLGAGGYCARLALRQYGSRFLALCALGLFLLHPRLYAHSFVNTKDIPFLSMYMVALCLAHRAFRKDSLAAFALCGAGIGLLSSIRILGVMLFVAVIGLRACDFCYAPDGPARRHVLRTCGLFAAAGALTLYAGFPYLWSNPLRILQGLVELSQHPEIGATRFQGETVRWPDIPAHYIPTWIAITTPPVVLLLSLAGMACTLRDLIRRPAEALCNTGLRFRCLLLGCLAVPIATFILLNANIYNGWRHLYFLYAPIALLAVFGLHWLASVGRRRLGRGRGAAVQALVAASIAATLVAMALIHPYQISYFNLLVDRHTPEYLRSQYQIAYWGIQYREGLEHLLERHPSAPLPIAPRVGLMWNRLILPEADRRRIFTADKIQRSRPHFVMDPRSSHAVRDGRLIYSRRLYNSTILRVMAVDAPATDPAQAESWRQAHWSKASGKPTAEAKFDLYLDGNRLTYIKRDCAQQDIEHAFFLHVYPLRREDLPENRRYVGFDNHDFRFPVHGALFDGKCLASVSLPEDYAIARLRTGQYIGCMGEVWAVEIRP